MTLVSTLLVSFLVFVDGQPPGRYEAVRDDERFVLDVTEDQMVSMTVYCDCGKGFYTDGPYRLLKGSDLYEHIIDFSGVCEGVSHWYIGIRLACTNACLVDGDFRTITFDSADTLTTTVGNKVATFSRSTRLLVPNYYYYDDVKSKVSIVYEVGYDGTVKIKVKCRCFLCRTRLSAVFRLVRNDRRFSYTTYDLVPTGKKTIEAFQAKVGCSCGGSLKCQRNIGSRNAGKLSSTQQSRVGSADKQSRDARICLTKEIRSSIAFKFESYMSILFELYKP
ncbi:hypothetical protein FOZ62_030638 [Perkinsus olseni]|uniref:Uncharacterized protein n=1 Tax=Perkinsus olseni TaxID=32597 RepID=A0A7J6QPX1_PEROL|nr:hypothetical protein FOZ62_030638 [Perkinsus olseni]